MYIYIPSLQIHFLYQYSLQFFLDIFQVVLTGNSNLKGVTDHTKRLKVITSDMFQVSTYSIAAVGILRATYTSDDPRSKCLQ